MAKEKKKNLLATLIIDLYVTVEEQMPYARKALGEDATPAAVLKEAKRRVERAQKLLKQLEIPLGTSSRPYPMSGVQQIEAEDGTLSIGWRHSAIASDNYSLKVYSERPYGEVMALAYCDMPVPSMLTLLYDGLERRRPDSRNRTQMVIGDPGQGKSYMGALQGRMRSSRPVEIYDCGGKNMNDLLFEMVLDFGAGDALPTAINKRLMAGVLEPMSLALLETLDDDVDEELKRANDKIKALQEAKKGGMSALSVSKRKKLFSMRDKIDKKMLESLTDKDFEEEIKDIHSYAKAVNERRVLSRMPDGRLIVDWAALKTGGNKKVPAAFETLKKISTIERLDNAGGNALGMNSQYGALIRAFMENREIVFDEYNKSREGSDNALQTVWQFCNGEIDTCTVENPLKNKDASSGPSSFTFKREEMGIGFFITLTGNKVEDGVTTRSLNKSVYSRLSPSTLPDPDEIDWQHRICQFITGVPVTTLYKTFKQQADADPAAFGEWLIKLRREKARIEGVSVPQQQEERLLHWQETVNAAEGFAIAFHKLSLMTNSDKLISNGYSHLAMEVDENYSKQETMDFRKAKQILEWAFSVRPRMEPDDTPFYMDFKNFMEPPVLPEREEENPSLFYGTRAVELLERMAFEKSEAIGKHQLYKEMLSAMKEAGLRDIHLTEAQRSTKKSVEESLNISSFADTDLRKQAILARKTFCQYLRQQNPKRNPKVSDDDEDITTVERMQAALEWVKGKNTAETKELFIVNCDIDTVPTALLTPAHIHDEAVIDPDNENGIHFGENDMVNHDDLLASLALPTVGSQNLEAIWDNNLRNHWDDTANDNETAAVLEDVEKNDEALRISENASKTGIAMTTLCVLFKDAASKESRDVLVHVVRNTQTGKTLIVSEKAPAKLLSAFKEAGITHVDRNDENAASKIDATLRSLIVNATDDHKLLTRWMNDAFFYRNGSYAVEQGAGSVQDEEKERNILVNAMLERGISIAVEDDSGAPKDEAARDDAPFVKVLLKSQPKKPSQGKK